MISIVICSVSGTKFAAISTHYKERMGAEPYEIIGIHDAKSMCDGYNRGFARSKGEYVIFCHDDIELLSQDFIQRLKGHMEKFDVVGVAGTDKLVGAQWAAAGPPHIFGQHVTAKKGHGIVVCIYSAPRRVIGGIQAMDGLFLAFRREVVEKIGGWDDKTFTGWHCYDVDMVFRAHLAGYRIAVANDLPISHASSGDYGQAWLEEAKLFLRKHAGKFAKPAPRWYQFGAVLVDSKEQAVELMKPRFWDSEG